MSLQAPEEFPQANPFDQHNQRLIANVHPADWVNPAPSGRYNMVVIGAGTAGLVTAAGAAGLGAKVALIERSFMGGDCLNVGCVPSKALIRCARAIADVRAAGEYGVRGLDDVHADFPAIMERMRRLRADISPTDSAKRFSDLGIDVFMGDGKFTGRDTVEVDGQILCFARACIATGARAVVLPIPGLAEADPLTNETIFSLTELPKRLTIVGGGPIGCELAQSFARFGSKVTLLEVNTQILIREDPDAAARVQESLVKDGVTLRCGVHIESIEMQGNTRVINLKGGESIEADQILLGVGRAPNVDGLGLEQAGVEFDPRGGVKVNDNLQTANPKIYSAGDVCSVYKFTHAADFMARIVIQNAMFFGRSKASALTIPWCTYTEPEIAHVGMYPKDAKEKGIAIDTFVVELSDVDRAILEGDTEGFCKVHVRKGTDKIVGATLVARHAGDMISELTVAMAAGAGLGTIAKSIHPYPTTADVIRKTGDAYNKTRFTPRVAKLFETILRWRR